MRRLLKLIITIILWGILVVSLYNIAYKVIEYKRATDTNIEINKLVKDEMNKSKKFSKLNEINQDYIGWIYIENTNINYPILQSIDNKFYLDKNIFKEKSTSGSIFLDHRNDNFNDKNTVIYGHYMKNNTMFGELKKFKKEEFFDQNNKIKIYLEDKELEYEVFSVYTTDTKFNYIETDFYNNNYFDFLKNIKSKSKYYKDIAVNEEDKILTLSTCSYEFKDSRLVIHAKLKKEIFFTEISLFLYK